MKKIKITAANLAAFLLTNPTVAMLNGNAIGGLVSNKRSLFQFTPADDATIVAYDQLRAKVLEAGGFTEADLEEMSLLICLGEDFAEGLELPTGNSAGKSFGFKATIDEPIAADEEIQIDEPVDEPASKETQQPTAPTQPAPAKKPAANSAKQPVQSTEADTKDAEAVGFVKMWAEEHNLQPVVDLCNLASSTSAPDPRIAALQANAASLEKMEGMEAQVAALLEKAVELQKASSSTGNEKAMQCVLAIYEEIGVTA